jgi:hypothetical protein
MDKAGAVQAEKIGASEAQRLLFAAHNPYILSV